MSKFRHFRLNPESGGFKHFHDLYMPACAGTKTFYETVMIGSR